MTQQLYLLLEQVVLAGLQHAAIPSPGEIAVFQKGQCSVLELRTGSVGPGLGLQGRAIEVFVSAESLLVETTKAVYRVSIEMGRPTILWQLKKDSTSVLKYALLGNGVLVEFVYDRTERRARLVLKNPLTKLQREITIPDKPNYLVDSHFRGIVFCSQYSAADGHSVSILLDDSLQRVSFHLGSNCVIVELKSIGRDKVLVAYCRSGSAQTPACQNGFAVVDLAAQSTTLAFEQASAMAFDRVLICDQDQQLLGLLVLNLQLPEREILLYRQNSLVQRRRVHSKGERAQSKGDIGLLYGQSGGMLAKAARRAELQLALLQGLSLSRRVLVRALECGE